MVPGFPRKRRNSYAFRTRSIARAGRWHTPNIKRGCVRASTHSHAHLRARYTKRTHEVSQPARDLPLPTPRHVSPPLPPPPLSCRCTRHTLGGEGSRLPNRGPTIFRGSESAYRSLSVSLLPPSTEIRRKPPASSPRHSPVTRTTFLVCVFRRPFLPRWLLSLAISRLVQGRNEGTKVFPQCFDGGMFLISDEVFFEKNSFVERGMKFA